MLQFARARRRRYSASDPVPRVEAVSPARTASKKTEAGKATDGKPTLMLLDGNSLAYRAFYALPAEPFDPARQLEARVDNRARVSVRAKGVPPFR